MLAAGCSPQTDMKRHVAATLPAFALSGQENIKGKIRYIQHMKKLFSIIPVGAYPMW